MRDRGIAYVGYRGLAPFLGICDVKCSVLGWGSEGLSGWFLGTVWESVMGLLALFGLLNPV